MMICQKVLNEIIDELANSTMPKASGEGERENNVNMNNNSDRNVGSVSNRRKVNLDIDTNSGNINVLQNDTLRERATSYQREIFD